MDQSLIPFVLLLHDVVATALLLVISWQTFIAWSPQATNVVPRLLPFETRDVIAVLLITTVLLGACLYPAYRFVVRPSLESNGLRAANGVFEIKESLAALALMMLPSYRAAWGRRDIEETLVARRTITSLLCAMVWWNFMVGHFLNLIKGLL